MTKAEAETEAHKTETENLPDGMGFSTPSVAYAEEDWEQQNHKEWPKPLHIFGVRQNQINRGTAVRLRTLEVENRTLRLKVEQLESELKAAALREKKSLGRVAVEMDRLHAELDRLRLSTQLNSNAVDRILKGASERVEKSDEKEKNPS